eukprot:3541174-Pleurochrysis_carterae.AAC.1
MAAQVDMWMRVRCAPGSGRAPGRRAECRGMHRGCRLAVGERVAGRKGRGTGATRDARRRRLQRWHPR